MVPIPAGTFTMGSPDAEAGRGTDEGPQHKVTLPAFYMAAKEVTWSEYDEFAFSLDLQRKRKLGLTGPKDAGDAISRPTPPYADESWGWGKEAQPVIGVTQYAASR
jgi:formylglycine-generating enzyme required for sulfatase activity